MTKRRARGGAAYLIALLASSIVTVTGMAALSISTSRSRSAVLLDQAASARIMARTSLEHALSALHAHLEAGGTRFDISADTSAWIRLQEGMFEWTLARPDGSPLGNTDEPVVIRAQGKHGQARYALHATLPPSGVPFDTLDTGLYCGGEISISALAVVAADKVVGSIGNVTATLGTVTAPIESAASVSGTTYFGAVDDGMPARRMPDASLIDHYVSLGERIDVMDLPMSGSVVYLEDALLSPSSNPFGATNPYGIYIIELGEEQSLVVRQSRIAGTLVILNAEESSVIMGSELLLEPAFAWMPSLLVRGSVSFMGTNAGPSESVLGVNLNPPHTPRGYHADEDTDDVYPGGIEGVSYVSGDAVFALPRQNIRGTMIVGGHASVRGSVTLEIRWDPGIATLPPVGFFEDEGGLALDPKSITWQIPD